MYLEVVEDYAALSRRGAEAVAALVRGRPEAALLLATGETPMGIYRELAGWRQRGELDTGWLRVFQLDEYWGLGPADRRSLYGWTRRAILEPLAIAPERFVRLAGDATDAVAECRAYDGAVAAAGGFDLALLGLGPNGHLGFNEPPAGPELPSRRVDLSEASIESNARYWGGRNEVPRQALTAGMAQLLAARQIVLVVSGAHKAAILRRALAGPPSPAVPASYLQLASSALILADRAAASGLSHKWTAWTVFWA
jgi:glucosamine-6-phosphate deaminase